MPWVVLQMGFDLHDQRAVIARSWLIMPGRTRPPKRAVGTPGLESGTERALSLDATALAIQTDPMLAPTLLKPYWNGATADISADFAAGEYLKGFGSITANVLLLTTGELFGDAGKVTELTGLGDEEIVAKAAVPNAADELATNGEGLFTNVARTSYTPTNQLPGQAYDFSCATASCTMAANLMDTPKAYVRQAILTDTDGTALSNIPNGLQQLGFTGTAQYSTEITAQSIAGATSNGASVIVNVATDSGGVHAIVVDSITDGIANIRDPWPLGVGSSYGVPVNALGSALTGKGVVVYPSCNDDFDRSFYAKKMRYLPL